MEIDPAIRAADSLARRRFTYRAEPRGVDSWRSFADAALLGHRWQGDCDDLASTALDLLLRAVPTFPTDRLFRLNVATRECPPGVPYDHFVAGYWNGTRMVIFGDTNGPPRTGAGYRVARYCRVDEGVRWRSGSPIA